jgi:hypothetical protein
MREQRVTVMYIVPSMLRAFFDVDATLLPTSLRNVSC